ncbi:aspartate--tRNA ligase [Candidatus Poriferisocius sp.]|uniref:aspartate--tRNA ligase n=1 Tax=Candidatus Poriferisocius sp. TaxID=3101276 RepID=UPI003B028104
MTGIMRTDYCGELGVDDIGREVSVCGWVDRRREHGENLAFIDLRDRTGVIQCVVDERHDLRSEYVVRISGTVRPRPEGTINPRLTTGEVEIGNCGVEVLSVADPPPFPLHSRTEVDENVRLRHRYIDLRGERLQRNLSLRATVNSAIRRSMEAQRFTEIETPMLVASTPEGARDFVVPSRLHPGRFYALPQSPQIFKQLCMVGGLDRYYQIARCLRDEDLRADRQFEFMQLDAEASFASPDEVMAFITEAVAAATEAVTGERPDDPIRMTWTDAMERYGSDKPDIRFGMELVELTGLFEGTEAKVFQVECIKGINHKGGGHSLGRNAIDELTRKCRQWGGRGLAWFRVGDGGVLDGALTKFMSGPELAALGPALGAEPGDLLLLIADRRQKVRDVLGLLRLELGRPPITEGGLNFVWVTDFPLFESIDDQGRPVAAHHPFTMPHPDDVGLLNGSGEELLAVRSQAYDLVLNGWELGSGSVRIHRPDIQRAVFRCLGISDTEAEVRFGFLLDAFRYGAPPHAGFAFGIDRLTAILAGEENIREVIAFPKTQSGADPLSNSPTPIPDRHLGELGLRLLPPPAGG